MKNKLISDKAIELLQFRIKEEQLSSRIYEQMSLYLNDVGLLNSAKLWLKYSQEELGHADWAKDYLLSFGVMPVLQTLEAPTSKFTGLLDVITKTLEHEELIAKQCNALSKQALDMGDFMLFQLGLKYTKEQSEEMDKSITLIDISKLTQDQLILDTYIGQNLL